MVIHSLSLENFRNYRQCKIDFDPGINFILGKNGQGKTNLIESLYYATHLKSFRTSVNKTIINEKSDSSNIRLFLNKRNVTHTVGIDILNRHKKVLLDQKKISYTSEYIKNFYSFLFAPDQLASFKEYPLERRTFFDRVLVLLRGDYFRRIKEFNKIKRQKTILLKRGDKREIQVWNQLLASVIPIITRFRRSLIEKINKRFSTLFFELTGRNEILKIVYKTDFKDKLEIDSDSVFTFLSDKLELEIEKGHSFYGAHKDAYWVTMGNKKDRDFFSQGEYRVSFLALQLTINEIIAEELDFYPIVLLDDVFSELDEEVCERVIDYVGRKKNQTFITSTRLNSDVYKNTQYFHIQDGLIIDT